MLYLRRSIDRAGDTGSPTSRPFTVRFQLPVFTYTSLATTAGVQRKQTGSDTYTHEPDPRADTYQAALPVTGITGGDSARREFLQFSAQALREGENGAARLAFPIGVGLRFGDHDLPASPGFTALYFIKGLNADGVVDGAPGDLLFLVNKDAYDAALPAFRQSQGERTSLLAFLKLLVEVNEVSPGTGMPPGGFINARLGAFVERWQYGNLEQVTPFIEKYVDGLFDFPLRVKAPREVRIAGRLHVTTADGRVLARPDFAFYHLQADYRTLDAAGAPAYKSLAYDWAQSPDDPVDNRLGFALADDGALLRDAIAGDIAVHVKGYDGTVLWRKSFSRDDQQLQDIAIELTEHRPNVVGSGGGTAAQEADKRLRGKLVGLTKECSFKDATVLVQAKDNDEAAWRVVGAATADASGNFSMPYPYGAFVAAQALVSLTPNSPADIPIVAGKPNETISADFLYLLVTDPVCDDAEPDGHDHAHDCGCDAPKKAGRLPSQEDLIASDEYTQDIGGSCVNLSTPNRTLNEYNYTGVVRTSDPDVANYTLRKKVLTLVQGEQLSGFELEGGVQKIARKPVNLDNPIRWQDAPDAQDYLSFYQAVTVATGHVLHYKSVVKADGYSLGNLLYSLPLAPGQKKQIVVFDSSHSLRAAESQSISQGEHLNAGIVDEREIADQLSGFLGEALQGRSAASTGGVSAGLGVGANIGVVSGALGVAGGYASSNSSASQNSSRNVSQFFAEKLRQAVMQNADSYRQLNASVVTTVQEGQHYDATTEVVANHNHCHALTMMYFEVLRHFAVFQELASVEECLFVPLLMTNFTAENMHKWADVLAVSLLPVPSNTWLQPFSRLRTHPLLKGFDANERIRTNYANVDFPAARYCDDVITDVQGSFSIRMALPRPKTKFDRILSLPIIRTSVTTKTGVDVAGTIRDNIKSSAIAAATGGLSLLFGGGPSVKYETETHDVLSPGKIFDLFMTLDENYESVAPARCIRVHSFEDQQILVNGTPVTINFFHGMQDDKKLWDAYADLLDMDTTELLNKFANNVIADWDKIFFADIAPQIVKRLVNESAITLSPFSGLDLTARNRYSSREQLLRYDFRATSSATRAGITKVQLLHNLGASLAPANRVVLQDNITANVEGLNIHYSTAHYNGRIYNGHVGDDLMDGFTLNVPMNHDEQRNPRKEDVFIVNKLTEHLNSNLEHYNKALWRRLDHDRRYMLLDGFSIQVYNAFGVPVAYRSLASVVKNELLTVAGNSLVFPVAPGYRVSQSYIVEADQEGNPVERDLFDYYRPLTPPAPFRISVPSRGVFLEAVQGACDACEKVKDNSSQDWTKFPADEPTPIAPLNPPVPAVTDWKPAYKDFAPPLINIQNAPAAPAPGAALAGLTELLGKAGIFPDITGLDANQQNVIRTYLSNQENAKAFAEMASKMSMQGHNTANSDKIMDTLKTARQDGALSQDEYGKLVKQHIQKQIDGGEGDAAGDGDKAGKPSLSGAAVKAIEQGKNVKAQNSDAEGNSEFVEVTSGAGEQVLAKVAGTVPKLKQANSMACWATVATMMVSWKQGKSMTVEQVLQQAGPEYVAKFENGQGLLSSEKDAFIGALGMEGEPPASYSVQQFIDWMKQYGPLWITTDSSSGAGDFSPHARIVTAITGSGNPDGSGTTFVFVDPATGTEVSEPFDKFLQAYEQMVTDNPGDLFIQIVHFKSASSGEGGGPVPPTPAFDLFRSTPADPLKADTKFQGALDTAVAALVASKSLPGGKFPIRIALADVTDDTVPCKAAFHDATTEDYIASEAKVSVMYAAFALRDLVQRFADAKGITSMDKLIKQMKLELNPLIRKAVPKIESASKLTDLHRLPNYAACFDGKLSGGKLQIAFRTMYQKALEAMIVPSNNDKAGESIHGIGYSYLNGALAAAGCLDLATEKGLWIGGDYSMGTKWPYVRVPCENDVSTAQGGTARDMARLLALLKRGALLDPAACTEQMEMLHRAAVGVDQPWLDRPEPKILGGSFAQNKLGLGPLGTSGPNVRSECSILDAPVAAGKKYVLTWQNMEEGAGIGFADLAQLVKTVIAAYEAP